MEGSSPNSSHAKNAAKQWKESSIWHVMIDTDHLVLIIQVLQVRTFPAQCLSFSDLSFLALIHISVFACISAFAYLPISTPPFSRHFLLCFTIKLYLFIYLSQLSWHFLSFLLSDELESIHPCWWKVRGNSAYCCDCR